MQDNVIKILALCAFSAVVATVWSPFLTNLLYKHKLWRKKARTRTIDNKPAKVFYELHKEREVNTPRMGGLLIWVTTVFVIFLFYFLSRISGANSGGELSFLQEIFHKLNFLSRGQTWLPLATLVAASLLGFGDDILQVFSKGKYAGGGIKFTRRLAIVLLIGIIGAWWFYFKLGWDTIHIPGNGDFIIGIWYLPLFVITVIACWAGGIIDGVDGFVLLTNSDQLIFVLVMFRLLTTIIPGKSRELSRL